mmetsp:Transcript_85147/g.237652  ORF Transcript_85147/g.237652 Transcript_85147/m.237652 type:complete len:253 (+) Transcript_85147:1064-1822(+)
MAATATATHAGCEGSSKGSSGAILASCAWLTVLSFGCGTPTTTHRRRAGILVLRLWPTATGRPSLPSSIRPWSFALAATPKARPNLTSRTSTRRATRHHLAVEQKPQPSVGWTRSIWPWTSRPKRKVCPERPRGFCSQRRRTPGLQACRCACGFRRAQPVMATRAGSSVQPACLLSCAYLRPLSAGACALASPGLLARLEGERAQTRARCHGFGRPRLGCGPSQSSLGKKCSSLSRVLQIAIRRQRQRPSMA